MRTKSSASFGCMISTMALPSPGRTTMRIDIFLCGFFPPLFIGRRSGVAIGPAAFPRQANGRIGPDLMPGGRSQLDYFQPPAEQFDCIDRLRALVAAVHNLRRKRVGAV